MSLNQINVNNTLVTNVDDYPVSESVNLIKSDGIVKYETSNLNKWFIGTNIESYNVSALSLLDVILDIWFETDTANFDNDSYYLKLGIVSFNANTLNDLRWMRACVYLTTGSGEHTVFGTQAYFDNPLDIQHIEFTPVYEQVGGMHMIVDFSKLDFSAFPSSQQQDWGYVLLNDGLSSIGFIVSKKKSSVFKLSANNYDLNKSQQVLLSNNNEKIYSPFIQTILPGESNQTKQFVKSIIDIWFTDITDNLQSGNGSWYDDNYKLKVGCFAFNRTTLTASTRFWFFMYFTNGTVYKTSSAETLNINNKNGIFYLEQTLQTFTGSVKVHLLIDFSLIDFQYISTTAASGFYPFINMDAALTSGLFLNKKVNTRYSNPQNVVKRGNDIEVNSKAVISYVASKPSLWCSGYTLSELNVSQLSLLDAFLDIWFEPKSNIINMFNNDAFYLKLAIVGVSFYNDEIRYVHTCVYLTDGLGTDDSHLKYLMRDIPVYGNNIVETEVTNENATIHAVIDCSKFDLSITTHDNVFGELIINEGITQTHLICAKKTSSILEGFFPKFGTLQYENFIKELHIGNLSGVDLSKPVQLNLAKAHNLAENLYWNGVIIEQKDQQGVTHNITIYKSYTTEADALADLFEYYSDSGNSAIFDFDALLIGKTVVKNYLLLIDKCTNILYSPTIYEIEVGSITQKKINNPYPSYKLNMFSSMLCAGDSATEGFVVEGESAENYETIFQVMTEYAWPTQFKKIHPHINIITKARSGMTPTGWLNSYYPNTDFSEYDLILFELGTNGGLYYDDLNTPDTNTYNYRQIIKGARQQNPNATIVLYRLHHFTGSWMPILKFLAEESNCIIVDGTDKTYIDLDDVTLHGWALTYSPDGNPYIDMAHFTRKGYNCMAYLISRQLGELLSNETVYE